MSSTKPLRRTVSCVDPSEFKSLIRLAKTSNTSSSSSANSNQKQNHKQNSQLMRNPNNKQNDQVSNKKKVKKESTLKMSFDNLEAKRSRLMKTSLMRVSSLDGDIVKHALESWIRHPTSEQKHNYANAIIRIQKRYLYNIFS